MVSTLDLSGGSALVGRDIQGNALRRAAAEMFTQWCNDAVVSEVDVSVARAPLAYGLDWYDMLGMFRGGT
jgi:hypothetical protein